MEIKFWKVGCGDAITIHFKDGNGLDRNIFIDSGYLGTYRQTIKRELLRLQEEQQAVDRWYITHTDRDHIGGVEAFLKDPHIHEKEQLVKEYWFNWSSYSYAPLNRKVSVGQGIYLWDYLKEKGKLHETPVIASEIAEQWYNIKITVLSPDEERLEKSKVMWSAAETHKIAAGIRDYNMRIETLLAEPAMEDTDPWNGGSIAFLIEYEAKKILFLADSYPSVAIASLRKLGYSRENKLVVDYIKLSHHGSKRNFSIELLELVQCHRFIILADGITHGLPNKWTLAQILGNNSRTGDRVLFLFNQDDAALKQIFDVDVKKEEYNFNCIYNSSPFLHIKLDETT